MLISASQVWLMPVANKDALLAACRRVLAKLNVDPAQATVRLLYGSLPDKSRADGETFSTFEEAGKAFCAREDAEFEFAVDVDGHTLRFSADFHAPIPSIELFGDTEGPLSPMVEKYRLSDILNGIYYFADYRGTPSFYVQNGRFFDLLLPIYGFSQPVLTSWDKVFDMYRLLHATLDRIGAYERLGLGPAACLERRDYPLIYISYAGIVISSCLKDAGTKGVDLRDLKEQCLQLTGKSLSEIYETDEDEEAFVGSGMWCDPEFVRRLAVKYPEFAALLARDVPKFATLLNSANRTK